MPRKQGGSWGESKTGGVGGGSSSGSVAAGGGMSHTWKTVRELLEDLRIEEEVITSLENDGFGDIDGFVEYARDTTEFQSQMMKLGLKKGTVLTIRAKLRSIDPSLGG